ncbi:protein fam91a1 [Anaeramoeba flamelloides]|uniref:Protein fam91a1 n=1 Tax=Anaeramoeba flamelloides TaxID=1746091 RepID=A0AAV7ZGB3_9EUKA|nr:protein fam91a1 [Anaeramoeba flamelloides]
MSISSKQLREIEETKSVDLGKYIHEKKTWSSLPLKVKKRLVSEEQYKQDVQKYAFQHQLKWSGLVAMLIPNTKQYYQLVLNYSVVQRKLFPYHLSDALKSLDVTPFKYYIEILVQVMSEGSSYDSIPNFPANDIVRLVGIGRNQYIDIANKLKKKSFSFFLKKKDKQIRELLPKRPVRPSSDMQPWFEVIHYPLIESEYNILNFAERGCYDFLSQNGPTSALSLDYELIHELYAKGVIYVNVPVHGKDYIKFPPLEKFVMNKDATDHFDKFLYKLFVTHNERMTVEETAEILNEPLGNVIQAFSLFCRLGFGKLTRFQLNNSLHSSWISKIDLGNSNEEKKKNVNTKNENTEIKNKSNENEKQKNLVHNGNNKNQDYEILKDIFQSNSSNSETNNSTDFNFNLQDKNNNNSHLTKTNSLIGNINSGSSSSISSNNNNKNKNNNNNNNNSTGSGIISGSGSSNNINNIGGKRIGFIFEDSLTAFLMMGNWGETLKQLTVTLFEIGKMNDEKITEFLKELDKVGTEMEGDALRNLEHVVSLRETLRYLKSLQLVDNNNEIIAGVDMLKESGLFSLNSETRSKMLERNYGLLISTIPYEREPRDTISFSSPIHFGNPIPECLSPWWRLFICANVGIGLPTVFFTKGNRVKELPSLLNGYEKIELMSTGRSVYCPSGTILFQLNDLLLNRAILLQGIERNANTIKQFFVPFSIELQSKEQIDQGFEKMRQNDINESQFDSSNIHTHPRVQKIIFDLNLQNSIGFVKVIYAEYQPNQFRWIPYDIQFGIPLFGSNENKKILNLIKKKNLFKKQNLTLHLQNMRKLSIKLMNFISNYCKKKSPFLLYSQNKNQTEQFDIPSEGLFINTTPSPHQNICYLKNKIFTFSNFDFVL